MSAFRSGVQILCQFTRNKGGGLHQVRSYSDDRHSSARRKLPADWCNTCNEVVPVKEKQQISPSRSWFSLFRREESPPSSGICTGKKEDSSWISFFRRKESIKPPLKICRQEEARKIRQENYKWAPDVKIITHGTIPEESINNERQPKSPAQPVPPKTVAVKMLDLQAKHLHSHQSRQNNKDNNVSGSLANKCRLAEHVQVPKVAFQSVETNENLTQPKLQVPYINKDYHTKFTFKQYKAPELAIEAQSKYALDRATNKTYSQEHAPECIKLSFEKKYIRNNDASKKYNAYKDKSSDTRSTKSQTQNIYQPCNYTRRKKKCDTQSVAHIKVPYQVLVGVKSNKEAYSNVSKASLSVSIKSEDPSKLPQTSKSNLHLSNVSSMKNQITSDRSTSKGNSCETGNTGNKPTVNQTSKPDNKCQEHKRNKEHKYSCPEWTKNPPADTNKKSLPNFPSRTNNFIDNPSPSSRERIKPVKSVGSMFLIDQKKQEYMDVSKKKMCSRSVSNDCRKRPSQTKSTENSNYDIFKFRWKKDSKNIPNIRKYSSRNSIENTNTTLKREEDNIKSQSPTKSSVSELELSKKTEPKSDNNLEFRWEKDSKNIPNIRKYSSRNCIENTNTTLKREEDNTKCQSPTKSSVSELELSRKTAPKSDNKDNKTFDTQRKSNSGLKESTISKHPTNSNKKEVQFWLIEVMKKEEQLQYESKKHGDKQQPENKKGVQNSISNKTEKTKLEKAQSAPLSNDELNIKEITKSQQNKLVQNNTTAPILTNQHIALSYTHQFNDIQKKEHGFNINISNVSRSVDSHTPQALRFMKPQYRASSTGCGQDTLLGVLKGNPNTLSTTKPARLRRLHSKKSLDFLKEFPKQSKKKESSKRTSLKQQIDNLLVNAQNQSHHQRERNLKRNDKKYKALEEENNELKEMPVKESEDTNHKPGTKLSLRKQQYTKPDTARAKEETAMNEAVKENLADVELETVIEKLSNQEHIKPSSKKKQDKMSVREGEVNKTRSSCKIHKVKPSFRTDKMSDREGEVTTIKIKQLPSREEIRAPSKEEPLKQKILKKEVHTQKELPITSTLENKDINNRTHTKRNEQKEEYSMENKSTVASQDQYNDKENKKQMFLGNAKNKLKEETASSQQMNIKGDTTENNSLRKENEISVREGETISKNMEFPSREEIKTFSTKLHKQEVMKKVVSSQKEESNEDAPTQQKEKENIQQKSLCESEELNKEDMPSDPQYVNSKESSVRLDKTSNPPMSEPEQVTDEIPALTDELHKSNERKKPLLKPQNQANETSMENGEPTSVTEATKPRILQNQTQKPAHKCRQIDETRMRNKKANSNETSPVPTIEGEQLQNKASQDEPSNEQISAPKPHKAEQSKQASVKENKSNSKVPVGKVRSVRNQLQSMDQNKIKRSKPIQSNSDKMEATSKRTQTPHTESHLNKGDKTNFSSDMEDPHALNKSDKEHWFKQDPIEESIHEVTLQPLIYNNVQILNISDSASETLKGNINDLSVVTSAQKEKTEETVQAEEINLKELNKSDNEQYSVELKSSYYVTEGVPCSYAEMYIQAAEISNSDYKPDVHEEKHLVLETNGSSTGQRKESILCPQLYNQPLIRSYSVHKVPYTNKLPRQVTSKCRDIEQETLTQQKSQNRPAEGTEVKIPISKSVKSTEYETQIQKPQEYTSATPEFYKREPPKLQFTEDELKKSLIGKTRVRRMAKYQSSVKEINKLLFNSPKTNKIQPVIQKKKFKNIEITSIHDDKKPGHSDEKTLSVNLNESFSTIAMKCSISEVINESRTRHHFLKRNFSYESFPRVQCQSGQKSSKKEQELQSERQPTGKKSDKKQKEVVKLTLPGCIPPLATECKIQIKEFPNCTKIKPPVPSYTECLKEKPPELRFTECNMKKVSTCDTEQKPDSYNACNPLIKPKGVVCPKKEEKESTDETTCEKSSTKGKKNLKSAGPSKIKPIKYTESPNHYNHKQCHSVVKLIDSPHACNPEIKC